MPSLFLRFILFLVIFLCVFKYLCVCAYRCRYLWRTEGGVVSQVVVSDSVWMLGTKRRSWRIVTSDLNF